MENKNKNFLRSSVGLQHSFFLYDAYTLYSYFRVFDYHMDTYKACIMSVIINLNFELYVTGKTEDVSIDQSQINFSDCLICSGCTVTVIDTNILVGV